MKNLYKKIDLFYKYAGLFEPAPRVVKDLEKKVLKIYASALLNSLDNLENSKISQPLQAKIDKLKTACFKYSAIAKEPQDYSVNMSVDLNGWKYLDSVAVDKYGSVYEDYLRLNVFFKNDEINIGENIDVGSCVSKNGRVEITIFIYKNMIEDVLEVRDLNLIIENIKNTIYHEVSHMCQFILAALKLDISNKKDIQLAGLPGLKNKTRRLDDQIPIFESQKNKYLPTGEPEPKLMDTDKENNIKVYERTVDPDQFLQYELRDNEYYPLLNDDVKLLKYHLKLEKNRDVRIELFKCWVGEPNNYFNLKSKDLELEFSGNNLNYEVGKIKAIAHQSMFLKSLMEKDTLKYKKAIKLIYTSVKDLL